jgi:cardiolipin synthase
MLNLPNLLTFVRILTIPFFLLYLSYHRYGVALMIFVIGAVTDFLDGLTARLMKQQTALGAFLDPIADKLLVMTSFVMLGIYGGIPMWLAVLVVSRDAVLLFGYGIIRFLIEERFKVKPTTIGKCSTLLQLLTLGTGLALLQKPGILDLYLQDFLIGATALATILSGLQYIYRGLVWLRNKPPPVTRLG